MTNATDMTGHNSDNVGAFNCTVYEATSLLCLRPTWRQIPGFKNYEISSHGDIRRLPFLGEIKQAVTHGYHHVSLSQHGLVRTKRVHVLVAHAFLGKPPFEGAIVAHNDGNRSNNRADNLRWASLAENQADRIRHKTKTQGSKVFGSKLTETDIPYIKNQLTRGRTCAEIGRELNVSTSTISLIQRGRTWRHA